MNSSDIFSSTFKIASEGQITLIIWLLEVSLVLGVIWLIFKKNDNHPNTNLTENEKEDLISEYKPECLVEDTSSSHYALKPRIVQGKIGMYINVDGIKCLNFATNDFLGFIGNEKVEDKVMKCIETYGVGACGPRGFYGTVVEHVQLEKSLAEFFKAEDSLVYSYGFATIASAIPAYAKKTDIIFADEKRNFAIQYGLDASKSEIKYFKHNDIEDLEKTLENVRSNDLLNMKKARRSRRYLVVEGIYKNTGEICPLPEIVKLCKKYKVRILIDESVSFGILGKTGRGVTEYFGIPRSDVDLIMGSLEYALASVGGFCVGSRLLIDHQHVSGQGFCFSASLPPLLVTAAIEALHIIRKNPEILVKLNNLCRFMHYKLNYSTIINKHFEVSGDQDSPMHILTLKRKPSLQHYDQDRVIDNIIECCIYKNVAITRAAFLENTDPAMTNASLRITTSIFHTGEHIAFFIKVLEDACESVFCD